MGNMKTQSQVKENHRRLEELISLLLCLKPHVQPCDLKICLVLILTSYQLPSPDKSLEFPSLDTQHILLIPYQDSSFC